MDRLNDVAKLAMFDDLQETAEELRIVNAELREELDRCEKRLSALAWSLECALAIAKNLPMPDDEEEPPKKVGKRKVGSGKMATANVEVTGAARLYRAASGGPQGYASTRATSRVFIPWGVR